MITTSRTRLGAVCVFVEERPSHSKYSVRTVAEALAPMEDMELLAISNGCGSGEDMKAFFSNRQRAFYLGLSANVGLPAAWNMGLDLLDCDYLFFLNDDLWLDRKCVEELTRVFEGFPDTAVVGVEGVVSSEFDTSGFPVTGTKYKKSKGLFKTRKVMEVSAVSGFLFALSMRFVRDTAFRFDTRFTPAFCEEFDLAFFARSRGYRTRIVTGLDKHYDHAFGISSAAREIRYLDGSVRSDELYERNRKAFALKWGNDGRRLLAP